jgi:RNA polymerase sigma-70 factor (ECF subfamily)
MGGPLMIEASDENCSNGSRQPQKGLEAIEQVRVWFVENVLPLETMLMCYLHRNWQRREDIPDLRNDIYILIYEAALKKIPDKPRQFIVTIARNLLIDRFRREQIVPIEAVADLDAFEAPVDGSNPEKVAVARDALRGLQRALEQLPARTREIIIMRRVEGLSRAQISSRLGISQETVSAHMTDGMRILVELFYGDRPDRWREP